MDFRKETTMADRRKFKRKKVSFTITYKAHSPLTIGMRVCNRDIDAIAIDLSEGGIGVLTNYEIPSGAKVDIRFNIFNESAIRKVDRSRRMEIQGEVRYSVVTKEKDYRLGIQFTSMSNDDRAFIIRFIEMGGFSQDDENS